MRSALIGKTGFVGGTLGRQHAFDDSYHSADIDTIRGRRYDLVACAGAPGRKWLANREPDVDRASIATLMRALEDVEAAHLVLISTVDVYPVPVDVDEDTPIDNAVNDAYGRHRLLLEQFVAARFAATIVRLPGLFGPGLKKNVIYDFLHNNRLDLINPESRFQFYDLNDLWRDIEAVRAAAIPLVNFATEPVSVRDVAKHAFGFEFTNEAAPGAAARYDFRSRFAPRLGGREGYLRSRDQVLEAMKRFVIGERTGAASHLEHRVDGR
jgi:nucleoside-diphosphate-sugar epimerase